MEKRLISIVGPTAIGKTNLAIQLARHYNTEIISCDSRQFFKEMSIGTAVPSCDELNTIKHHFIQNISIHTPYSVGDYEKDALTLIETLFKQYNTLILVGGSGMYEKALLEGLDRFPDIDETIKASLVQKLEEKGINYLQNSLLNLDPISYNEIDINNPNRVIRALSVCLSSNKIYSSFKTGIRKERTFSYTRIGITAPREIIYDRINKRVDIMMEQGLFNEAKELYPHKKLNALQTVGYKELFNVIDNETSLEEAIEEIKKNTRRFSKRQLTWFNNYTDIEWFNYNDSIKKILSFVN